MTEFASLPPVTSDGLQPTVAAVAKAVADRADRLVDVLGEAIIRKSDPSGVTLIQPHDDIRDAACRANIRTILAAMVNKTEFDSAPATQIGVQRAHSKTALSSLMAGDRIGFRRLWEVVANEAAKHLSLTGEALRSLTARLHAAEELYTDAMVAGYRDELQRHALEETSSRAVLIDSLLYGRIRDDWSLWDGANLLRLPIRGPFVVIAADLRAVGTEALPDIESKLASLDVYSAWRVLPDVQIGIAHVKSDRKFDEVVALVRRVAAARVGISARFDELRDTPHALHCAKVTLRGRADPASGVAVFDGSILATAAVSAPQIMVKSVGDALNGFRDLADEEREILFNTFRVWQDNDSSIRVTAQQLVVHPNTVRQRLRRIEKHTGRPFRGQGTSPNCAWPSKYAAGSCNRTKLSCSRDSQANFESGCATGKGDHMAMERQDIEQVQQRSNQLNADATVEQVVGEARNAPPASVLITEQEIKFGTASAVGLPRSTAPRWVAAIRTVVVASRWAAVACAPAPNRGYPKLSCSYLQRSLIDRESRRL